MQLSLIASHSTPSHPIPTQPNQNPSYPIPSHPYPTPIAIDPQPVLPTLELATSSLARNSPPPLHSPAEYHVRLGSARGVCVGGGGGALSCDDPGRPRDVTSRSGSVGSGPARLGSRFPPVSPPTPVLLPRGRPAGRGRVWAGGWEGRVFLP